MALQPSISSFLFQLLIFLIVHVSRSQQLVSAIDEADIGSFSADLIHHDSPLSPFYNSSETYTDRMNNALRRSILRVNQWSSSSTEEFQYPVKYGEGEYYMKYYIGTPQIEQHGTLDTGSYVIWTQCRPCDKCYRQKDDIFDPKGLEEGARRSSTYKGVLFESPFCKALYYKFEVEPNLCGYETAYVEGTTSKGDLAEESFTIGDSNSIPGIVFGCGHENKEMEAIHYARYATGVIGLGDNKLSLIYQMPIKPKFSYCLVDRSNRQVKSKINFGSIGMDTKSFAVVSTPLVKPKLSPTSKQYHISLKQIDIGDRQVLVYKDPTIPKLGNMIVDCGTTYSYIHPKLYNALKAKMEKEVGAKTVEDPAGRICFKKRKAPLPSIAFHFDGGAKLTLPRLNIFVTVGIRRDIQCLIILPRKNQRDAAIFGVWGQANFVVGYDLDQKRIFFMEKDCTEY